MGTEGRFKRSLLGYRPSAVDEAIADREAALEEAKAKLAGAESRIAERDAELAARRAKSERGERRIHELDQVSARLAERVVERERQLREVRAELAQARERADESLQALTALADDLETVRRQARGQATRIRLRALREAAELTERIGELGRHPGEVRDGLLESLQEAIRRVGAQSDEEEAPNLAGLIAAANGHRERQPGELFEGLVEVDVGPLSDFSQLVGFEDAASGIGAMSEISVKRFKLGRATLAMRFKQPVELLRELEERAPFVFKVRDKRSDRVVLDVDE
jgi:multidrug efflux pump subunit AcrA (membrane-fusion protein)